jgi:hypothetical protein
VLAPVTGQPQANAEALDELWPKLGDGMNR